MSNFLLGLLVAIFVLVVGLSILYILIDMIVVNSCV
jgi:hypothetical protein